MPLKNGNTVGLERRMDLASLFCLIGRHGPAVALAVIAMMSVLAGFIIYRSVRGKRRRQAADTDPDAAADGDSKSPGAEGDRDHASVESWPSPGESNSSTDVSDEGSSDVQDDADLFRRDVKIRHRRAAAATKPSPRSPPRTSDVQIQDDERIASDDTEAVAVVQDSYKVVEKDAEEATQNLQSDSYAVAEMEVEDAGDRRRRATDEKEPWFMNDEEKAFEADDQEDVNVATDEDVSDQKTGQEEEHFPCASNNRVCFDQTPRMNDDGRQDDEATSDANGVEFTLEEPVNHIEDVPVSCICYAKDEELEEESRPSDCIDDSDHFSNHFSAEEEKKNESKEAEEECEVQQLVPQRDETRPSKSEQEPNLDECDNVTDRVTPPIPCSGLDVNGGLAGERIDEDDDVPTANELQMEQEDVNGLACDREDGMLLSAADIEKEKIPTSDDSVAGGERRDTSGAALGPTLESVENHEDDLSGVDTDTTDIADFPLDCQQPQSEQRVEEFDEDTDLAFPGADLPSVKTDLQYEKSETEESVDPHCPPPYEDRHSEAVDDTSVTAAPDTVTCEAENIMAGAKDQQSMQTIDNEALDESSDSAVPDTTETITAPVISEEESCPHFPSVCQDQKIDHSEIVETATEAAVCDIVSITTPVTSEETSPPDTLSFSRDQGSDLTQNNEGPLTPMYQIHLPSFDIVSSPGVGVESGISSMAVSPDLPNAGGEFGETAEDMMPDCDPPSEDSTEAQNGLFADDEAVHVIHEDTAGWVFGPYPPRPPQRPRGDECDSFTANEDAFGHEIEDGYHRALERLMAQITSSADEPNDRPDVSDAVEVVEVKEDVRIAKKMETEAEEEKEADYERTEISIMEATMDNNEWITDNYQVHPWMNLSGPSFSQDHTQTEELPAEGCLLLASSSSCTEADTEPPIEVEQTDALPAVEENAESNNKKVVAVQPVPQSVDVTFRIHYLTRSPYQTVAVTGNRQELGNWKDFVPLERAKDGHWAAAVRLPAESRVQWKFVLAEKGEVRRWEECGNRLLDTGCGDELTVHKWWGLL